MLFEFAQVAHFFAEIAMTEQILNTFKKGPLPDMDWVNEMEKQIDQTKELNNQEKRRIKNTLYTQWNSMQPQITNKQRTQGKTNRLCYLSLISLVGRRKLFEKSKSMSALEPKRYLCKTNTLSLSLFFAK